MFDKQFVDINTHDIETLITQQVPEGRRLDYKEQIFIQSDSEKKEFLADVSAFANTDGGYIIFGVQEQRDTSNKPTGNPSKVVGLANFNSDTEILRIESIIRDGLAPRLSNFLIKKIDGFENGPILIISIPQSWNGPHMVTLQTKPPFFSRGNAGKFPMDIGQIRSAFTFSENLSEKIRSFHKERVSKIIGGSSPVPIIRPRQIILHLIPLASFRGDISLDVTMIQGKTSKLAPLSSTYGFSSKVNLDGVVFYTSSGVGGPSFSYIQIFRNGIIEISDCLIVGPYENPKIISTTDLEQYTIEGMNRYLNFLSSIGISGPGVILTTLNGVKEFELGVGGNSNFRFPGIAPKQFDRDLVTIPEVIVDDFDTAADVILKPIFDAIYNAAGWDKCVNYDSQGRWKFPRN